MDVGFEVARVDRQGPLELLERPLALAQKRKRQPQQLMGVGEPVPPGEHLFDEVHDPVIVLHRKALPRLGQQVFDADLHEGKIIRY